ncbi:MAG: helix-turn-helix domain-containing protein [Chloroflexota bacterium]|nr:helix-turn-helix domain-containing protein [Chloroflexota bacterium]
MDEKRLTITVEEAARLLGISRGLAYQMAREHKLPAIRLGKKRIVVPKHAIEKLLEEPGVAAVCDDPNQMARK